MEAITGDCAYKHLPLDPQWLSLTRATFRVGRTRFVPKPSIAAHEFEGRGAGSLDGIANDDAEQRSVGNIDGRIHEHERAELHVGVNDLRRWAKSRGRESQHRGDGERYGAPEDVRSKLAPAGLERRPADLLGTGVTQSNDRTRVALFAAGTLGTGTWWHRKLAKAQSRRYDISVRRNEVTKLLSSHRDELNRRGVISLLVFGSVARDEAGPNSDVDLIAEFDHSVGYLELSRVQRELERLLGCRVDLATPGRIRKEFRDRVYAEAVRAA